MSIHSEIVRYMGHKGAAGAQLEALISSCLEKFAAVSAPRHIMAMESCKVTGDCAAIGGLNITSSALAAHINGCTQAYVFAATLGADVDRLIAQRTKIDSAEALCLQACAAAQIEDYCDKVIDEASRETSRNGLYLRPRFSPGYGDFDIAHQTDILRILQAHKRVGITETNAHMLTPLKSITAIIGAGPEPSAKGTCAECNKTDCPFRQTQDQTDD